MHEMKMTPHESLQILELLNIQNLAYTKSVTTHKLITCKELEDITLTEINSTEKHINELRNILEEKNEIK